MIDHTLYTEILTAELRLAMGCTEPIALSFAASILRDALGQPPEAIEAKISGNIIKNVKSVIVPATGGMHGIEAALAAGILSGAPERKLEVLTALPKGARDRIEAFLQACPITVSELTTDKPFEVKLSAKAGEALVTVHLSDRHTHVEQVTRNGEDITARYRVREEVKEEVALDYSILSVEGILEYADSVELSAVRPLLLRQIEANMAIAEEGLRGDWGASIGKILYNNGSCSLRDKARAMAAAGSDARMSGCEMPVCILSGSGNQGITTSVPVIVWARERGATEEELLRALLVADLITIHQKTGIGCLSAYCGAISAGVGCAAGICYLEGGRFYEVAHTVVNGVAILSGTICDGAKPSCAAKIAMAVEAGLAGYEMTKHHKQFYDGDGIVTKGVENTIRNVGRLACRGMSGTDKEIIKMMLKKDC